MKNIVCHGLGETPKQWESVLRQIPTKVECPELFNFVQEKVFTYQKLYKAFERYCDSESENEYTECRFDAPCNQAKSVQDD